MTAYYFDPATAQHWLEVLQTVQVGYGAVLLSFLGAIHWGLEFAGMGGYLVLSTKIHDGLIQIGLPSLLFRHFGSSFGMADRSASDQFRTHYTISWIHRDVLG